MLIQAALITTLGLSALPQDTDHLLSKPGDSKVVLLVDESCSMTSGSLGQLCPGLLGSTLLNGATNGLVNGKTDQLRAALTGCVGNDGVIDVWGDEVEMAIMGFGGVANTIRMIHDFSNDRTSLEDAVLNGDPRDCNAGNVIDYAPGIRACNNTPLSEAIDRAGKYHQDWWTTNAASAQTCDRHYVVLLSDGNPNGNDAFLEYACNGATRTANRNRPWEASEYLFLNPDQLCSVPGDQKVFTYTIGFGSGNFNESILVQTADNGGGFYRYAADSIQLSRVFDQILQDIVSKEALTFGTPSVSADGFFSGNFAYISQFKPRDTGAWFGNLRKACILPDVLPNGRYDTTQVNCLFVSDDGTDLFTNIGVKDEWALRAGLGALDASLDTATNGGSGVILLEDKLNGAAEGLISGGGLWTRREVLTWEPGVPGYISVSPATMTDTQAGSAGCAKHQLMAFLHGYEPFENFDCTALEPTEFPEWSMGAVVNSGTALMAYSEDCETAGNCTVAVGTNHGQIHFFDAATGEEHGAVIPGDLWNVGYVTERPLIDALNQPSLDYKRLPLVDGDLLLYHADVNANAIIDAGDTAYLIQGLGHGGSAYYFIDVTQPTKLPSTAINPVYPLVRTPGPNNWTDDLRSTEAAPAVGVGVFPGSTDERNFVALTSGGVWDAADPAYRFDNGFPGSFSTPPGSTVTKNCTDIVSGIGAASALICEANIGNPVVVLAAATSTVPVTSYDSSALTTALGGSSLFGAPYTVIVTGVKQVKGITFNFIDLEPGDKLLITDSSDNVLLSIDSTDYSAVPVPYSFLTSEQTAQGDALFKLRIDTDGVAANGNGVSIASFDVVEKPSPLPGQHKPFMAVLDASKLNASSAPEKFASKTQPGGELLFVTSNCGGTGVDPNNCIDAATSPDLSRMLCPISAPPAVFTEGGLTRGFYFGDWCGQLWRIITPDQGVTWKADIILRLNERYNPATPLSGVISRQFRRIETKVDLFLTSCQGSRAVGVSFGSGNKNRPGAIDDLLRPTTAPSVTNYYEGRDVVGTFFDTGIDTEVRLNVGASPDNTCGGDCLVDATNLREINPKAPNFRGFFFALNDDERMIRDSLTLSGITFYKTFEVTTAASICEPGSGLDRVYALDNCTAEPNAANGSSTSSDPAEARTAYEEVGTGGGELFVVTPESGSPIVSSGSFGGGKQRADLLQSRRTRGYRTLFLYQPEQL